MYSFYQNIGQFSRTVVDSALPSWSDLKNNGPYNLLTGNGVSQNMWEGFGYKGLFDVVRENANCAKLSQAALSYFTELKTENFEMVLSCLQGRLQDHDAKGETIRATYLRETIRNVQIAFFSAIQCTHPPRWEICGQADLSNLAQEYLRYNNIFTTNEDLILYWIMNELNCRYVDFFLILVLIQTEKMRCLEVGQQCTFFMEPFIYIVISVGSPNSSPEI